MTSLAVVKEQQQQAWSSGDYGVVGSKVLIVSELLCETVDPRAGDRVLDVATGHGNAALAAARRGGEVTGIDYVPEWLERARDRANAEGLNASFQDGDAENIPFPDNCFGVVLSTYGAPFAPNHEKTASELLRVCRPGGKIGMANWMPVGFIKEFFEVHARHVPPPPEVKSPLVWGTESGLRELFGDGITSLQILPRTYVHRYRSVDHFITTYRNTFGPTVAALEALDAAGKEALAQDLAETASRYNIGARTMVASMDYIEAVMTKR